MKKIVLLLIAGSLCVAGFSKTIYVKNETEIKQANSAALPGDVIVLQNGNWQNISLQLTCSGTATQPVIFRAATRGQVIIKGKSSLRISGNYIVVDGLLFTEGEAAEGSVWEFKSGKQVANNSRITNCIINGFNNHIRLNENYWVAFYGKNNRIDHCNFINKTNLGVLIAVILDDDRSRLNSHSIDSNYFGVRKPLGSNGGEMIRIGVSQHCTFYSNTVVKDNLFEHCDGETEIISIKSCGNIIRNNVFKECQGAVVLRHGNNNTVEGNSFWGNGKEGSGGVRIINEGNWIVNNLFFNCRGEGFRSPLAIMNGVFNSPPNRYLPVRDAVVAHNTFFNCKPFSLGEGADTERSVPPINVYLYNNLFYSNLDTTLYFSFSNTDSIYINNNIINSKFTHIALKGFNKESIPFQKWGATDFPVYTSKNVTSILPDSLLQQQHKRLLHGFPNTIGCTNIGFFKTLFTNATAMGAKWKPLQSAQKTTSNKVYPCKDAASLYAYLKTNQPVYNIELSGTEYIFDQPIIIAKNTRIQAKNNTVVFKSLQTLSSLFEVRGNTTLQLNNVKVNAASLQVNDFITADSAGSCIHFSLLINNCSFSALHANSFFSAFKNSYADEISITKTTFITSSCNFFNLKDERDNKGYYNAEKIFFEDCLFENTTGAIMNVYRGGNDESTMGPKLFFVNNIIKNAQHNDALIRLFGVQQSVLQHNRFINANTNKVAILYLDNVRADHKQFNNTLTNSGTITENKFVTNIK